MPDNIRVYSAGPLTLVAILAIIAIIVIIVPLMFLGLAGKAVTGLLGLSWLSATALVLLILLCSLVDIPVWKVRRTTIRIPHNGQVPEALSTGENGGIWETTIAVNLGGAIIPLVLAVYLLDRVSLPAPVDTFYVKVFVSVLIVAAMSYVTTRAIPGVGIRAPLFIPGLAAMLCGVLLAGSPGQSAGVIAFVSGTVGLLLGADVAHMVRAGDLETPKISIGGAGTFGAIFIACLLSALIS